MPLIYESDDYIGLPESSSKLDILTQNKQNKLDRLLPSQANTMSAMDLQEVTGRSIYENFVNTRPDGSKFIHDYTIDPTTGEYANPNKESFVRIAEL